MDKAVIGTKIYSVEEVLEEYGRVCEENEEQKKQISELESELSSMKKIELPTMPIDVASMLINATVEYTTNPFQETLGAEKRLLAYDKYSKNDLREIAEHLLAYCNNPDKYEVQR